MVTEAAFRIFRSPVSTPVTISNLGIDLGVMAKLKPFSSTAVCVLLSSVLLKLTIHFFFKFDDYSRFSPFCDATVNRVDPIYTL